MTSYQPSMTKYEDFRRFIEQSIPLEKEKKTRYFRSDPGPIVSFHFRSTKELNISCLAFVLSFAASLFKVSFRCQSIGYGTYKATFTVIANDKDDAEKVVRFIQNSKRISDLTKRATAVSTTLQKVQEKQLVSDLPKLISEGGFNEVSKIEASKALASMISVVEEELKITPSENATLEERANKLDEVTEKSPPPQSSSFWVISDAFGAFCGGMAKSLGGG